jgi:hypothetical protein
MNLKRHGEWGDAGARDRTVLHWSAGHGTLLLAVLHRAGTRRGLTVQSAAPCTHPDERAQDKKPYPLGVTWVLLRCRQNGVSLLHLNTHFEDGPTANCRGWRVVS